MFRTNDLQDIMFRTLGNDITVTINNSNLFVPIFIPITETQIIFIESIENNYTITYDS